MNTRNISRRIKATDLQREKTYYLHETIALKCRNLKFMETSLLIIGLYRESSLNRLLNLSGTRGSK